MSRVHHTYWLTHLDGPVEAGTPSTIPGLNRTNLRFKLIPNCDKHLMWASIKVQAVEEVYDPERGLIFSHQAHGSPSARWKYGPECSYVDYLCLTLCSGLCRHEIVGSSAERAVYDLFWQALLKHEDFRRWVREIVPDWWRIVEENIEKEKRI